MRVSASSSVYSLSCAYARAAWRATSTRSRPQMSGSSNARVNAIESPPSTTNARNTSVASSRPMTSGGNGCSLGFAMGSPIRDGFGGFDHLGDGRQCELFKVRRVRHWNVLAGHAHHRRIEIVEGVLHDPCGDFGADAVLLPAFLNGHGAAGLLHRGDDGVG